MHNKENIEAEGFTTEYHGVTKAQPKKGPRRREGAKENAKRERNTYFSLIRKFPLKPLRTEAEYDEAVAVMEKLAVRGEHALDSGERDYLGVLGRMISDYDDRRYPIGPDTRTPAQRLGDLMSDHGMNISALGRVIGSQPAASMVVNGHRRVSREQARKLADHFHLDMGYFL